MWIQWWCILWRWSGGGEDRGEYRSGAVVVIEVAVVDTKVVMEVEEIVEMVIETDVVIEAEVVEVVIEKITFRSKNVYIF